MKSRMKMPALETVQYLRDENIHEVQYFFDKVKDGKKFRYLESINEYGVFGMTGNKSIPELVVLNKGDYIRRDIRGVYYVVPENMFDRQYERVDE